MYMEKMCRCSFTPFHPQWWLQRYAKRSASKAFNFVPLQVVILPLLLYSTTAVGWFLSELNSVSSHPSAEVLVILLVTLAFVGVAIACWTTLPQVAAIDEAREQARAQFQAALDAVPAPVYWVSSDLKCLGVNRHLATAFNLCPQDFIDQPIHCLNSNHEFIEFVKDFFTRSEQKSSLEINTQIGANCRSHLIIAQKYGEERAAVFVEIDITARQQMEEALRESEERYALAMQGTNDGLWDWNLKTNEVYFSGRWKSMLDYEESEIGNTLDEWFGRLHPGDAERIKMEVLNHLAELSLQFESEYRILCKGRTYRWMLSRGVIVRDASGKAYRIVGTQTDITYRKFTEEQLLHDASHDALTGLPNRVLFMERLSHAISLAKRRRNYSFAVLFFDLDRFKLINDSLGHLVGDQLLIAIARRLEKYLRVGDTVARLGGDEFTILLEDIRDGSVVTNIVNRLQEELTRPFNLNGHEVFTSTSIGIALSTIGYDRPEDLLRDADIAMYRAKASGKARYEVFDTTMHTRAVALLQLETDLRRGLEREEFQLHYQPIVSLQTDEITGFEALIRWQHPQRGLVSPTEFIPFAEETGLIVPIGWWVFREACHQMRIWQLQFPEYSSLVMSINLSAKQFAQPDLLEQINQILQETNLEPSSLKLEITESVVMENAEAATAMLLQLRALGIRLSIDDFGTGYSSLAYLYRFPTHTLKIDRSFINKIDADSEQLEIVRTIVTLASNLGMDVIAEGVETVKQLAQLKTLNCECGQGYFFSKPVDSQTATALLANKWTIPAFSGTPLNQPFSDSFYKSVEVENKPLLSKLELEAADSQQVKFLHCW
jgi:diguanylate cyclase (GGDEF)-like protein/PAS domain S-box-containing protein